VSASPGNRIRSFVVMSHAAYQLPCLRPLSGERGQIWRLDLTKLLRERRVPPTIRGRYNCRT
jgi:hypothetical protein